MTGCACCRESRRASGGAASSRTARLGVPDTGTACVSRHVRMAPCPGNYLTESESERRNMTGRTPLMGSACADFSSWHNSCYSHSHIDAVQASLSTVASLVSTFKRAFRESHDAFSDALHGRAHSPAVSPARTVGVIAGSSWLSREAASVLRFSPAYGSASSSWRADSHHGLAHNVSGEEVPS